MEWQRAERLSLDVLRYQGDMDGGKARARAAELNHSEVPRWRDRGASEQMEGSGVTWEAEEQAEVAADMIGHCSDAC